mmetsp:Transcript_14566/g.44027  ORF Transcript_14566/g.44027 Transcript_14566/m.44027 type:complete len:720 (-) Transcript_14566:607-2766(-)
MLQWRWQAAKHAASALRQLQPCDTALHHAQAVTHSRRWAEHGSILQEQLGHGVQQTPWVSFCNGGSKSCTVLPPATSPQRSFAALQESVHTTENAVRKQHVHDDASSVHSGNSEEGGNSEKGGISKRAELERLRHQVRQLANTGLLTDVVDLLDMSIGNGRDGAAQLKPAVKAELWALAWKTITHTRKAESYTTVLKACWESFLRLHSKDCRPAEAHIHAYIDLCEKYKLDEAAYHAFKLMQESMILPRTRVYARLIESLGKMRRPELAFQALCSAQDAGANITLQCWVAMLEAHSLDWRSSVPRFEEIERRLKLEERAPREFLLSKYLQVCAMRRLFVLGSGAYHGSRGLMPYSTHLYSTAIMMFAKFGDTEQALKVYREARLQSKGASQIAAAAILSLMTVLAKKDGLQARKLLDDLIERNEDDVKSWTALCSAYARNGEPDGVRQAMREMTARGHTPNAWTWSSLVHGESEAGRLEAAQDTLSIMQLAGFRPNVRVYSSILRCQAATGKFDRIAETLAHMKEAGVELDWVGKNILGEVRIAEWFKTERQEALGEAIQTVAALLVENRDRFWAWQDASSIRLHTRQVVPPVNLHGLSRGTAQLGILLVIQRLVQAYRKKPAGEEIVFLDLRILLGIGTRSRADRGDSGDGNALLDMRDVVIRMLSRLVQVHLNPTNHGAARISGPELTQLVAILSRTNTNLDDPAMVKSLLVSPGTF